MQKPNAKNLTSSRPGLVISYFGNSVAVEAEDGQVFQCHLRRNQDLPVVGDRVEWQFENENTGIILSILPRSSTLTRGDARGKIKPIAANLDAIFIVMSPPPIFSEYLVDRYLVASELLDIPAIIVLNKIDLLDDATKDEAYNHLEPYRRVPYPIILSSIYTENGLQELGAILKGKTGVLVGPSGVGKSSIIAKFCDNEVIKIGDVTRKGSGKHTTTATRLYHLPQGGSLIDSPGVREFNLWSVTKNEILNGFKEFQNFLSGCKFRDCSHTVEPGCAVQTAVGEGKISKERFASYQKLRSQAKESEKKIK